MKKKWLVVFLLTVLGAFLVLKYGFRHSDSFMGRISVMLFEDANSFTLETSGIDPIEIEIVWSTQWGKRKLVESGIQVAGTGNEYGPNGFIVSIRDTIVFKLGHWKTNRWNAHDYEIVVRQDTNGYAVSFLAEGPNYDRTEQHYNFSGELEGVYRSYYENGNLSFEGVYLNGRPDGVIKYYFENGSVRATNEYHDGKANGDFISYWPDGRIEFKSIYVNGEEVKDSLQ
jgi:hypothetical protein